MRGRNRPMLNVSLFAAVVSAAALVAMTARPASAQVALCPHTIQDNANPGPANCIPASSVPQLGMLFPISSQLFVDKLSGFIGFGTITPTYNVEIANPVSNSLGLGIRSNCSNATFVALNNTDPVGHNYYLASWGTLAGAGVLQGKFSIFDNTAGVHRLVVDANGNVGIGASVYYPAAALQVGNPGDGTFVLANSFNTFSSRDYKKNVVALTAADCASALDKLVSTPVYRFHYKDQADDSAPRIGLIVEESPVEVLASEAQIHGQTKAVDLARYVSVLHAALKAQQTEIDALKRQQAELQKLRADVDELRHR